MAVVLIAILLCLIVLIAVNPAAMALLDELSARIGRLTRGLAMAGLILAVIGLMVAGVVAGIRDPNEYGGILAMLTLFAGAGLVWLVRAIRRRQAKR